MEMIRVDTIKPIGNYINEPTPYRLPAERQEFARILQEKIEERQGKTHTAPLEYLGSRTFSATRFAQNYLS
ncbi:hypothetical protein FACS1894111_08740 [Clostridia bacterium]|nr:hypothetical protein FACS1894111_08740 [Clostridia bacterium]